MLLLQTNTHTKQDNSVPEAAARAPSSLPVRPSLTGRITDRVSVLLRKSVLVIVLGRKTLGLVVLRNNNIIRLISAPQQQKRLHYFYGTELFHTLLKILKLLSHYTIAMWF